MVSAGEQEVVDMLTPYLYPDLETTTIEDVIEPFLLQEGYIKRTSRGRIATEKAYRELKLGRQGTLFDE